MLSNEAVKLVPDDKIRRIVLCSGKIYYDLYEEREKRGIDDIYRCASRSSIRCRSGAGRGAVALQEGRSDLVPGRAPNMGAWPFIEPYLEWVLNQVNGASRRPRMSAAPLPRDRHWSMSSIRRS